MLGHRELKFDDYIAIARRRLWVLVLPALVMPLVAYLVSLKIPNRFTSQTLVLVEQQRVPDNFVKPVITQELTQRLATIQEQILSRSRLEPIIERFGLYKEDQGKVPTEELLDRMRKAVKIAPLRSGGDRGMPGFYISFTYDQARTAQQVCSQITSMFMEENLLAREQRAESTTDFLTKQLEDAKAKLDSQDAAMARFKSKYLGQLPGQEQTNLNLLTGFNTQLEAANQAVARLQQEKTYTESMLTQQLSAWELTRQPKGSKPEELEVQLRNSQTELARLQGRYTPNHPDVMKAQRDVAALRKKLDETRTAPPEPASDSDAKLARIEPPEIQKLRAQLHEYEVALREKTAEQKRIGAMVQDFQSRLQLTPRIEEEYKNLTRDYTTALAFYNDLLAKQSQAAMATDLERRQQGEQFHVMDPANLPEKPSWPNRPLITAAGFAGGLFLGFGVVLLLEVTDKTLRTEGDVREFLKVATLASLPLVGAENPGRFWQRNRKLAETQPAVRI